MVETEQHAPLCPRCGSEEVAEIFYGYPAPGAIERLEAEKGHAVILGGCTLGPEKWQCRSCGHGWPSDSDGAWTLLET